MKKKVFIKHLDYQVPKGKLYFKDHLDYFTSDENNGAFQTGEQFMTFAAKILNTDNVAVEEEMSLEEMSLALLKKNIESGDLVPSTINYILIATEYPEHLEHFGHYIQHNLDMPQANVIRITDNYCTNVDVAIGIAGKLLATEDQPSNILIITGCKEGKGLVRRVVGSYGVIGDATGLAIISNDGEGALAEVKSQEVVTKGVLNKINQGQDNTLVHFQAYAENLNKLLETSEVAPTDIDQIILHNANQLLVEQSILYCGIESEIDKTNHSKYGHLGTTDLVMNLKDYINRNKEEKKEKKENILTVNIGITGTYASTIFTSY